MKIDTRRIFISDLPDGVTEQELRKKFAKYGEVASTEIRERKTMGPRNVTNQFAFVNLLADDYTLQKCFNDFANKEWNGLYLNLQVAKESFLDKLKRERDEQKNHAKPVVVETNGESEDLQKVDAPMPELPKVESPPSSDTSSDEEEVEVPQPKIVEESKPSEENECSIIIKNNKNKMLKGNKLVIESQGFEPIIKVDLSKKKKEVSSSEQKRLESLSKMKKQYNMQKAVLKAAFSNLDKKPTKISFNDDEFLEPKLREGVQKKRGALTLFEDEDEEGNDNENYNFEVKEQYEGEKGKKLWELQSKSRKDKRFEMDARFLEDDDNEASNNGEIEEDTEISIQKEKAMELKVLERVLGKKIVEKETQTKKPAPNYMIRYDPANPEHQAFEVQEKPAEKKSKKRKIAEQEEENLPEVSKTKFYEVAVDFKKALQEKESFSLLSAFGKVNDDAVEEIREEERPQELKRSRLERSDKNPFKYDTSDEEIDEKEQNKESKGGESGQEKNSLQRTWHEPFFFTKDDYRFQEGRDYIQKASGRSQEEFLKLRGELKRIIKAKVKNVLRKDRPFKKKLGGNARKKMNRKKKALNR